MLAWSGMVQAQMHQGPTSFAVDYVSVKGEPNETTSRLDIYAAIPYTSLRFLNVRGVFEAQYEMTTSVFELLRDNKAGALIQESTWQDQVSVYQFGATQASQNIAHTTHAFDLDPGSYFVQVRMRDLASEQQFETNLIVEARDYTGDLKLSDLILVSGYDLSSQSIAPVVSDRVFTSDPSFKVFYELYADQPGQVQIVQEVIRTPKSRGLPLLRWLFRSWLSDDAQGEISYTVDEKRQLRAGRNPSLVTIPVSEFESGEYLVRVRVEDLEGNTLDHAERAVTMEWADEAEYQGRDIDQAIAQLKYIAKPRELREIRDAKTKSERMERFLAFWEKRDPTPNTAENERMDEYYDRIDYANRHYTGSNSGWKTDRGHTLILYGEPDEIVGTAADVAIDQPYEVWHYHRIGRRFVFVDRAGTGRFELVVPTWNERSPIR